MKFAVVDSDGANVLLTPMERLQFAISMDILSYAGHSHTQTQHKKRHHEYDRHENVAILGSIAPAANFNSNRRQFKNFRPIPLH